MSRKCDLTGKGVMTGYNVPASQHKTKKLFKPNLQKKTFMMDGKKVTMKLSTSAIRTLKKKGVIEAYKAKDTTAAPVAKKKAVATK